MVRGLLVNSNTARSPCRHLWRKYVFSAVSIRGVASRIDTVRAVRRVVLQSESAITR